MEKDRMLREEYESIDVEATNDNPGHNTSLHPRLAWMLCYNETGSAQEVCKRFGISRKTFYKWLKRYKQSAGNASSLQDQSRRPHRFPRATPESSVLLLRRLKEQTGFGQRRLKVFLQERYNINLSERTIWKILKRIEEAGIQGHHQVGSSKSENVIFPTGV
jgi:transposase